MILQKILCEVPGCGAEAVEKHEGSGWQGWGSINGLADAGVIRNLHLCPNCLQKLIPLLKQLER